MRELLLFTAGAAVGALVTLLTSRRKKERLLYAPENMELAPCGYEVVDVCARRVQL